MAWKGNWPVLDRLGTPIVGPDASLSVDARPNFSEFDTIYHLNHAEVQFGLSFERQVVPWVWVNVKGGYQVNFTTRFESTVSAWDDYRVRPGNAPYFKVGLFLSPPDKFSK